MPKFDDLLTHLGTGRWNLLYAIAMGYWALQVPYHSMGAAFLTPHQDFTCVNSDVEILQNRSQCIYNITTSDGENEERLCTEWAFDNSTYASTITSEFGLVCEFSFLRATFKSVYFLGAFVGSILNGWISDKYGRKKMHTAGVLAFVVLGNSLCWMPNISAILVARFLMGVGHPSSTETGYSLVMETCEPRLRSVIGILVFLPWCFSLITLGGYGYLLRDWRWLMFTVSLPGVLYLPMLWLMDESPRWLIVRGRHAEALRVLRRASRWNKVELPSEEQLYAIMKETQAEETDSQRREAEHPRGLKTTLKNVANVIAVLFRTRKIRTITLCLYANFFLVDSVYYGLSLGGDRFGVDPYAYMALGGVMETPANSITIPLVEKLGRRASNIMCFVVSGVALLALGVTPSSISWLVTAMIMIGKLAITAAYMMLYFHANELFPTEGSIGSWVPLVTFGGASLVAAGIMTRLPETRGVPMKDTVAELEDSAAHRARSSVTFLSPSEEKKDGFLAVHGRPSQSSGHHL
ncbi:organic cation transporter protein-like isoform X2 [Penaeus chinensis]|uniref:organic cation transporter protein-like isoform X2 n=1 Tax=Penaeus chinensis TaxID=139456 RepID=UPI001FB5C967|nr:organic cation transporter protein-like isoform X2 [Penaeus chinensis]